MDAIWLGLWPNARTTQVLGMRSPTEAMLKATLSLQPSSVRAMTALFEALALWEGRPVRAVLVADESSTKSSPTTLYRDSFAMYGERTPLYDFEWASHVPVRRRRRDALGGVGNFVDLERFLIRAAAR
jgi:hypothetical protein